MNGQPSQRVPRPLVSKPFRSKKNGPKGKKKKKFTKKAVPWRNNATKVPTAVSILIQILCFIDVASLRTLRKTHRRRGIPLNLPQRTISACRWSTKQHALGGTVVRPAESERKYFTVFLHLNTNRNVEKKKKAASSEQKNPDEDTSPIKFLDLDADIVATFLFSMNRLFWEEIFY